MESQRAIAPADGPIDARIRPPGSKSLTNRALVCAALADGPSTLTGALVSDDTRVMIDALNALGIAVAEQDGGTTLRVAGAGGSIPALEGDLFIGNSGTTVRFLAAMLTLGHGAFRLDGVPRMRQRPIADLVDALNALGGDVRCEAANGCPPLWVHSSGLLGGEAVVRSDVSSQFLSALLMVAPCAAEGVRLRVRGKLVSRPYVRMTLQVMREFGVSVAGDNDMTSFDAPPSGYRPNDYAIEPDASAASYFWAAAAVAGGEVTVEGLCADALQGDVGFVRCLEQMGCGVDWGSNHVTVRGPAGGAPLRGVDVDMNAISDTAQTLAAVALFAEGETRIRGIAHNRHKETDRIADLATELRRVGAGVDLHEDGMTIRPPKPRLGDPSPPVAFETYEDHRMAMSLALVGLRRPGVTIRNPGCTAKTYPGYFEDLERATGVRSPG